MIQRAEYIFCIACWTTGMNLLPKETEIHFTAHISFGDQFSCCMIVINVVAGCDLLPQITDMNDISSAVFDIYLYLCSSSVTSCSITAYTECVLHCMCLI